MNYNYKLSEEIARWSFEVHIKELQTWWISFTNPTAGPWKRIEAYDEQNIKGEVYRFDIEEKRPDIIVVNDKLKIIIIFEAKDFLKKLNNEVQIQKSARVINDMSIILQKIENRFWGKRNKYSFLNGLLWGSNDVTNIEDIYKTFENYNDALKNIKSGIDTQVQIGVEALRTNKDLINLKFFSNSNNEVSNKIMKSFKF